MNFEIKKVNNHFEDNKEIFNDYYLNNLIDFLVNYEGNLIFCNFVRNMFYFTDVKFYNEEYNKAILLFEGYVPKIYKIVEIFKEWRPFEKYNLGLCRGIFLEILSFKLIKNSYNFNDISCESKFVIEDYTSYTWDFILTSDIGCFLAESKFSSLHLKRKHLDQMIGSYNKLKPYSMFLIIFEDIDIIIENLYSLQGNTTDLNFRNILNKFTLISMEDFIKGNPFLSLQNL